MDYSTRTHVMGVLNCTPDSFSDGSKYYLLEPAVAHAKKLIADGADIIDIGGESSRPGSDPVDEAEEMSRVLPVIAEIRGFSDVTISIDTMKPAVAREALTLGASIINDITGLSSDEMCKVAAEFNATVIIMHMQGTPKTMQADPSYEDVVSDIKKFFSDRIEKAKSFGIKKIILDPGIGFGKNLEHNLEIFRRFSEFSDLGYPLLMGCSRKSFMEHAAGLKVDEREEGTIAANTIAIMNGANIIRVHDVLSAKRACLITDAIKNG